MKTCKNCNQEFPYQILIEGKKRNLKNRSYCLDCSPFNLHNTKKLENDLKCLCCNNDLQGNQTKYCSNKCKEKMFNKDNDKNTYYYQTLRGIERKIKLIELKGGKCSNCGYNKNISALDFHHIDSKEKKFSLDMRTLSNSKWENLLLEVKKCDLLCSNCHREKHYPENDYEQLKIKIEKK